MNWRRYAGLLLAADVVLAPPSAGAQRGTVLVDLTRATIVTPSTLTVPERTAVRVLVEEIEKRTTIRLPVTSRWPADTVPVIALGPLATASGWAVPGLRDAAPASAPGAEGYRIIVNGAGRAAPTVLVLGADSRGVLFGAGRLLRELQMTRGSIQVPSAFSIVSTPQVALRGHQLGYRPKTNSYDAWDLPMWEQYIRDLAIFGTNAIELIPPRSDDAPDSPHFPLPQMQMMVEMSRIANEYGLDVWVWYPALDTDYGDPKQVDFALEEWAGVLSLWDTPLQMRYSGLDRTARYRVRVVYAGDVFGANGMIRLVANDTYEIHPLMKKESPVKPVEFDVPAEATRGGDLTLTFTGPPGTGGSGRANQIAEVWLLRK